MTKLYGKDLERAKFAQEALAKTKMVKPAPLFIGQSKTTAPLYKLEQKRSDLFKDIATEWSKVCDVPESEYWNRAIPQVMFDFFDNYSAETSCLVAEAFLERMGYTITRPTFE